VFELYYENGLLDLPYAPDVGDYLVCEVLILWICSPSSLFFLKLYATFQFLYRIPILYQPTKIRLLYKCDGNIIQVD